MLHEMGIETGIDLPALIACSRTRAGDPRPPARQPHAGRRTRRLAAAELAGASPPAPRRRSRARLASGAATQYSCTATSISSVCASAGPGRGVDHALGAADGDVGVGEQLVDQGLGGRLELVGRDHAVDEADPLGLLGVDRCAPS